MRVLLIYSNRSRIIEPVPPIGLSYVATAARAAGHDVRFLDFMVSHDPDSDLQAALDGFDPEVVGISVRNIDTVIPQNLSWQLGEAGALIGRIRQSGERVIVLGGSAISVIQAAALERLDADFAIIGEGEAAFPKLLDALENGEDASAIEGLCYRVGKKVFLNEPLRNRHFGPSGLEGWVRWSDYEKVGGTFAIHTKRGCPRHCIYCNYPAMEGREFRCREAVDVVDEIERVHAEVGPRTFEFTDTTFNLPSRHAAEICEEILRRNLKVNLSAVGVNPAGLTAEFLALMKRAGFRSMVISADAGNDAMLKNLQKGFCLRDVERAAVLVKQSGISSTWFFLLGGPGETEKTVDETLAFIETRLNSRKILPIVMTGIRILPGTPLALSLVRSGELASDRDLTRPTFYFSPRLEERWVLDRIHQSLARCPAIVHGGEESGSPAERLFYAALRKLGVAPPHMRFLPYFLKLPLLASLRERFTRVPTSPPGIMLPAVNSF